MKTRLARQLKHIRGRMIWRPWRRLSLQSQGIVLAVLPVLALIMSAGSALLGNRQRATIEADVQRKFELVGDLGQLLTLMVNAETGMRGYLLTRRTEFLQPYTLARTSLPPTMAQLQTLTAAEPGEKPRIEKLARLEVIQTLVKAEMSDLALLQAAASGRSATDASLYDQLTHSKQVMDELRAQLDGMTSEEQRLLTERVQEINAVRQRDYLAVFAALVVGVGIRFASFHLFNTGIVRRVQQLVANTRALRQGEPLPYLPSGKRDPLGELERELALAGNGPGNTSKQQKKPPSLYT